MRTPTEPGTLAWADVSACTLPTPERPLRLAEFDDLFAAALRSIDRADLTHATLLLTGDDRLADRTRRLANAETACCSFFAFTVDETETGHITFHIEVPATYADVLDGLLARAELTLGGRR